MPKTLTEHAFETRVLVIQHAFASHPTIAYGDDGNDDTVARLIAARVVTDSISELERAAVHVVVDASFRVHSFPRTFSPEHVEEVLAKMRAETAQLNTPSFRAGGGQDRV
jgi:hypothetical protein